MISMKFPEKLWSIVNGCTTGAIAWGYDGKTIIIDYGKFEKEFLAENSGVFKTKNVVSFIRQLNLYGFRKCSRCYDVHEFGSPYFMRGRKDLLKFMRRNLGYTLKNFSPVKEKSSDIKTTEGKKENSMDKDDSTNSSPSSSSMSSMFLSQGLNSMPHNWWRNNYFSMNSMYGMNNPKTPNDADLNIKVEKTDSAEEKEDTTNWKSSDMFNNIIFVPVPAPYGMYPGFFNGNYAFPFAISSQGDKNSIIRGDQCNFPYNKEV